MINKIFFAIAVSFFLMSCSEQEKTVEVTHIPSESINHRYVVQVATANNDTLNFFTDTGGGIDIIWKSAHERLELPSKKTEVRGRQMMAVDWDSIGLKTNFGNPQLFNGDLIVFPAPKGMPASDGFLGGIFFVKGSVWEFDYLRETIGVVQEINWPERETNKLPMFIKQNEKGEVTGIHSALNVMIEDDTLKVLFDTGATFLLTEKGREVLDPKGLQSYSGSYLSAKMIEDLHANHPDWEFIEEGSGYGGGANMIKVPKVRIGNYFAENVWFAARPKTNFVKIDDDHLDGALGGNAFKDFIIIADYTNTTFEFEKSL